MSDNPIESMFLATDRALCAYEYAFKEEARKLKCQSTELQYFGHNKWYIINDHDIVFVKNKHTRKRLTHLLMKRIELENQGRELKNWL